MRGDYLERRYSDDELRRIIDQAAQSEIGTDRGTQARDGHTLAEMREIAREVGIDPAAVDKAAAQLVASASIEELSRAGPYARVLQDDAVIPRALTEAEMRRVALRAEDILGRRGLLREAGDWVEWRDSRNRLYVGVVRGRSQTRVRVITDQSAELLAGSAAIIAVGALLVQNVLAAGTGTAGIALTALVVAATAGLTGVYWRWRNRVGRGDLQDLLDILEDAVRR